MGSRVLSLVARFFRREIPTGVVKPLIFTCTVGCGTYCTSILYHSHKWKYDIERHKTIIKKITRWWQYLHFHDKFFYSIVGINGVIYLCWKSKQFHPLMIKHFLSSPSTGSTSSLLLCTFSHIEMWHLAINMFVFWSFVPSFVYFTGRENSWPFYLTAGTFSAMIGHYYKLFTKLHSIPSLGASGALLAIVSVVVLHSPDSKVYIIFLPFIPIPAYMGLTGVVLFDIMGLIRGWRVFDHAAHLGGVIFGVIYYYWLHRILSTLQPKILRILKHRK